jgi:hypothetical protein
MLNMGLKKSKNINLQVPGFDHTCYQCPAKKFAADFNFFTDRHERRQVAGLATISKIAPFDTGNLPGTI